MSAKIELRHLDCTQKKRYITVEKLDLFLESVVKIDLYDIEKNRILPVILDKPTAIKFAKTLRTEINKIQD